MGEGCGFKQKVALTRSGVMDWRDCRVILVFNRAIPDEREDGVEIFLQFSQSSATE